MRLSSLWRNKSSLGRIKLWTDEKVSARIRGRFYPQDLSGETDVLKAYGVTVPSNKRIASNVVASNVLSEAIVPAAGADGQFSVHCGGGGFVLPGVSTSPAIIGRDRTQNRQMAESERFMVVLRERK